MKEFNNILVIGAGLMGSGIAQASCEAGYKVYLNDISEEVVEKAILGINARWESKVARGKITEEKCRSNIESLVGIVDCEKIIGDIDLVIEAASEKFEVKKSIFNKVSKLVGEDTILASNTSSISITKLAAETGCPERFIGTHFFSPVPVMKLVEIIPGLLTSKETKKAADEFIKDLGKTAITVKDAAGFAVNRLLDPMINEAIRMVDEGVATVEEIDIGAKLGLNHPMGPFELVDMAGIDVLLDVMKVMHEQTANPHFAPAPLLVKMVESGMIGKKVGRGFYVYDEEGNRYHNPAFD